MGFLGTPLGFVMYGILEVVNNYGWALMLFVLLTRVILIPLSIKQQKSTARTAMFQPKLKALEKKYGKDKQKYQEEMMKLYEQEGISPTAGCLPMLVQFALLFGIIDVIYKPLKHLIRVPAELIGEATKLLQEAGTNMSGIEIKIISAVQQGTNKDLLSLFPEDVIERIQNFDMNFLGIDMGAIPTLGFNWLMLIPVIAGVTALLMSIISMKQQEKNGQKMQGAMKYMMYFSPILSVWIGFSLPAGVGLYWIVSNVFQIVQLIILGKIYTPEKISSMVDKNADKNREKLRLKREKMAALQDKMVAKGKLDPSQVKKIEEPKENMKEKEISKQRLAEARKRMAEKYGEEYNESEDK